MSGERDILAKIARQHGGTLLNAAIDKALPQGASGKTGLIGKLAGAAALRIATRSIPGAIVVGGGLLAKTLYDRRRARAAREPAAPPPPPRQACKRGRGKVGA